MPGSGAALRSRRCLVPADAFYEWQATLGRKLPWRSTVKDGGPFAITAPWEGWDKAPNGVPAESCAIITSAANALVAKLHDGIPVIPAPDDYPAWLGEDEVREVAELLRRYPT